MEMDQMQIVTVGGLDNFSNLLDSTPFSFTEMVTHIGAIAACPSGHFIAISGLMGIQMAVYNDIPIW